MRRYVSSGFCVEALMAQSGCSLVVIAPLKHGVHIICCMEIQVAVLDGCIAGVGMGQFIESIRTVVNGFDK